MAIKIQFSLEFHTFKWQTVKTKSNNDTATEKKVKCSEKNTNKKKILQLTHRFDSLLLYLIGTEFGDFGLDFLGKNKTIID